MYEMAVVAGDLQIPFHNPRAVLTWLKFIEVNKDKITDIVLNGDILDFPYLSLKFLRDPAYRLRMQADITTFQALRDHIDYLVPKATKHYIMGNHEERWIRYVQSNADEIAWLLAKELSLASILGVAGLPKWKTYSYGDGVDWHTPPCRFWHGQRFGGFRQPFIFSLVTF